MYYTQLTVGVTVLRSLWRGRDLEDEMGVALPLVRVMTSPEEEEEVGVHRGEGEEGEKGTLPPRPRPLTSTLSSGIYIYIYTQTEITSVHVHVCKLCTAYMYVIFCIKNISWDKVFRWKQVLSYMQLYKLFTNWDLLYMCVDLLFHRRSPWQNQE